MAWKLDPVRQAAAQQTNLYPHQLWPVLHLSRGLGQQLASEAWAPTQQEKGFRCSELKVLHWSQARAGRPQGRQSVPIQSRTAERGWNKCRLAGVCAAL